MYNHLATVEPLYKDTPEMKISPSIRTSSVVPDMYKKYPRNEDISFNQDTLSCPKGVRSRGFPLYTHQDDTSFTQSTP